MATAHVTFNRTYDVGGQALAAYAPSAAQTITTSGTSQQTTITAGYLDVATITVTGGAVFIAVGTNPTAASGAGYLIPDGGRLELAGLPASAKVAVINA